MGYTSEYWMVSSFGLEFQSSDFEHPINLQKQEKQSLSRGGSRDPPASGRAQGAGQNANGIVQLGVAAFVVWKTKVLIGVV